MQEFRDSNVQGIRPDMILYLPVPVRDEDEDGWSDTTHESWVEVKTLHWGTYYDGRQSAKAPVQ